jgi:PAS domain S-box-containing protein
MDPKPSNGSSNLPPSTYHKENQKAAWSLQALRRRLRLRPAQGGRFAINQDLGLQILMLYIAFIVPVVVAGLIFDRIAIQNVRSEIVMADLTLSRAIAQDTDVSMTNALEAISRLADYPEVISADPEGMEYLFSRVYSVRPEVNLVYRLSTDGEMLFHYPTGPDSTVGQDFSFREYFMRAHETNQPLVSLGRISPTTNEPVATALMPIWDGDQFLGVIATNIRLQFLSNTLSGVISQQSENNHLSIQIIDTAGMVIAHPDPDYLLNNILTELPKVAGAIFSGLSGNTIMDNPDGEEHLYSYVPVSSTGWGVIVARPTSEAFATPNSFHQGILITMVIYLGIGLFFWVVLYWRVVRPVERLAAYSLSFGESSTTRIQDYDVLSRSTQRRDQIGRLVRSFVDMEKGIQTRINELSTLLETSTAVVSTLDTSDVLNRIFEQVEQILSIHKGAIVVWDEEERAYKAQTSQGLSQRYTDNLIIGPEEFSSVTIRAIKTGQPIQISDTETNPSFTAYRERARSEGYRSLLAIPLKTVHAPPAALLIYNPTPHEYTEREINLLKHFANHAAMAIENAALFARSDARLREQTRRLEALIQSMEDGLILEDLTGKVLYANRRVSDLTGFPADDLIGQPVSTLVERVLENARDQDKVRGTIETILSGNLQQTITIAVDHQQGIRYLRLKFFTVTGEAGLSIGRGQLLQDITQGQELDRMKSSLISTVSHELRTPLAAIKGYVTTLLAEDVNWEQQAQQEFLSIILEETDRLSDLVNDLLDMSRIEAGNLTISRSLCNLKELVTASIHHVRPPPDEFLKIDLPPDLPLLFVDPHRIEAVLRNLVENAVKHTPPATQIRISARHRLDEVIVYVSDEGPGISTADHQHVFESFYRVSSGLTQQAPGAGLGLSICQGFIHAHGGKIWLEPTEVGACMAFSLPAGDDLLKISSAPASDLEDRSTAA